MISTANLLYSDKKESSSLWNFSLAPGWTKSEVQVFRLCLMKYGFGKWNDIVKSNYLIGKSISQMCNQLQRMVGQQSIGEFYGLHIDPERIFEVNRHKDGARKNGCLINTGANPTKAETNKKRRLNDEMYSLPRKQIDQIVIPVLDSAQMSSKALTTIDAKIRRLKLLETERERILCRIEGRKFEPLVCAAKSPQGKKVIAPRKRVGKRRRRKNSEDIYADDISDGSYGDLN